jgi:hypothetical protein
MDCFIHSKKKINFKHNFNIHIPIPIPMIHISKIELQILF